MTHLTLTLNNYLQNPISVLLSYITNKITSFREAVALAQVRRSTIKELSKLSDRELRDIGISRGDIYSIAYDNFDMKRRLGL